MRLQKFLSRAGVASRRKSEGLIEAGRIRVNGEVVRELGSKVDPDRDRVEFDGRPVELSPRRWVMYNKPKGLLTTEHDPHGGSTIFDHLPDDFGDQGMRYVGRLDQDTEGLLLLTNDGDTAHRLTHPSFEVEREYEVGLRRSLDAEAERRLLKGVELDDGPARVDRLERVDDRRVRVVLREGRNREVRRLFSAVGHRNIELRRVRYGPLELGRLEVGQWRDLDRPEVAALLRAPEDTNSPEING